MRRISKIVMASLLVITMLAGCAKGGSGTAGNQSGAANSGNSTGSNAANTDSTGNNTDTTGTTGVIELSVYAEFDNWPMLEEMFAEFKAQYPEQQFEITLVQCSDADAKNTILGNVHACADVFSFPDDQFSGLLAAGVVTPVENQAQVRSDNVAEAIGACEYNGTIYGYPYTADNGYFLYYNKKYFKDSDVATLDKILDVCEANGKYMSMDFTSGWYLYSFFGLTGMEFGINDDGVTNHCNWNSTTGAIKGTDVIEALYAITSREGFKAQGDGDFVSGMKDGTCIAGISGTWNAATLMEALGNNLGAVKLPTYTVAGKQLQMSSFTGYKIMGVNYYSKNRDWAQKLAAWITNEKNQTKRFEVRSQGPSNIKAAASDSVSKNVAIAAILEQSQYGVLQRVGSAYWSACSTFADNIVNGNASKLTPQEQLDKLVKEITAGIN